MIKKAIIPAAGFGTRMLPYTKAVPKEMITLVDRPAIDYAIDEAVSAGIEEIILVTSKSKNLIEDYYDRYFELENALEKSGKKDALEEIVGLAGKCRIVSVRQKEQLGLGHAVYCAADLVGDEPFAVILPDDLFLATKPVLAQLKDAYEKNNGPVLAINEVPIEDTSKYGVVDIERDLGGSLFKLKSMVEKPKKNPPSNFAIVGRYILTRDILDELYKTSRGALGEIQLTDAINAVAKRKEVYGLAYEGRRFDCGSKIGYLEAVVNFTMQREDLRQDFIKIIEKIKK
ncbi:MAG: UTP--glucose-phosphate uridylyltransferase [Deferribacteres bacterium]|jgi:UTP--glucose-1-phosphate uridylyltransferase|nr:UTP-glucose-phosphate uridylyltransferase [Deferribacteraceae bacterium]MDK2791378.1 UTP--glucose-phosphate uridylyltransferase [Deferribacteres bacterium]